MGIIKHSQSTQSNKFAISLQHLKIEVRAGVHFLHADKHQSFYNLALSFLMEVVRHFQNTQNRKLEIFLKYLKKKKMMKFIFCMQINKKVSYKQRLTFSMCLAGPGQIFISGCVFESSCSHLNFGYRACCEERVPWHSGNYRTWIHSEICTWHDKNIQSNATYR